MCQVSVKNDNAFVIFTIFNNSLTETISGCDNITLHVLFPQFFQSLSNLFL